MEFIETKTGRKVKMGDQVVYKGVVETEDFKMVTTYYVILKESNVEFLLEVGAIKKYEPVIKDLSYYKKKLAAMDPEARFNKYQSALLSMILKEIAMDLDKKYPNHISESPEIYVFSLFDGLIHKANKENINSYKYFAAFRSMEDALKAFSIVQPMLEEMFCNGAKQ